jgi:outer membrane protein TolC
MKRIILLFLITQSTLYAQSKEQTTLLECYTLAQQNFPLAKQRDIIAKTNDLNSINLRNNYLPQIELNGQATYQSDVTAFPIKLPNIEITPLSKDQYKLALDVRQVIWDGGVIKMQDRAYQATAQTELQKIEVEMYKLKERVNQLYFNILQADESLVLMGLFKQDLVARIKKIEAGITQGVALKKDLYTLQAEELKIEQRQIETRTMRSAAIEILNQLTGQSLTMETKFEKPEALAQIVNPTENQRPELTLFDLQKRQIDQSVKIVALKNYPRIFAFGTVGYGRPGLNFLKNEFVPYGLGGVSLKWNLADLYSSSLKNDLQIMRLNTQALDIQRDIFRLNTTTQVQQQNAETLKLSALIEKDKAIIGLREKIKATALAQFEGGVITASDYIIELNAENQARQNLALHELQLLNAYINLITTVGK